MKKFLLALTSVAAFSGSAFAADLPARTYTKAPLPVVETPSWTGCYLGAGGGGGMTNNKSYLVTTPGLVRASTDLTQGGSGVLITAQGGCDYQINRFVIGAFVDGDWTNIRGDHTGDIPFAVGLDTTGRQTLNNQWAIGARAGYLIFPSLLTYVSAGYTQGSFSGVVYNTQLGGVVAPTGDNIPRQTVNGWFIGAGDEYKLDFLPGLFWKTEYRFSQFNSRDVPVLVNATGLSNGFLERTHYYENSVRTELVYRFNWAGPVVAKY